MSVPLDMRYAITLSEKIVDSNGIQKKIPEGSILKIQNVDDSGTFTFIDETDYERKIFKTPRTYTSSDIANIVLFSPDVYKFAIAIKNPKERIKFCKSEENSKFITQLKEGDPVRVPKGCFSNNDLSLRRAFVKYVGLVEEVGPGYHFIVTLMRRDWTVVPPYFDNLIAKYVPTAQPLTIIASADYIYHFDSGCCINDVELFHLYRNTTYPHVMNRINEPGEKLTKAQAQNKRNSSSVFESASKTEKPFNVNGKDIYVIESNADTDNAAAAVQIVKNKQYEDRSSILFQSGKWPELPEVPFEMLNGKRDESSSSTGTNSSAKQGRSSSRSKSLNPLDHINHDSRNANRDAVNSRYSLRKQPQKLYTGSDNDANHTPDAPEEPIETFTRIPGSTLGIDAMVTVETGTCEPLNGVIRAIFKIGSIVMVGVEIEDFISYAPLNLTDGSFSGHRFFKCQNGKALFIEAECCHKDNRFADDFVAENKVFGHPESPIVTDIIPPISLRNLQELEEIIGESKGIQGHNNSCYLDATLFSMFTFAQCFDSLLYRAAEKKDIKHYDKVRAILRDEIVHPLRKHHFVRADRVLKLRELLEEISTMTGLTNEEKDPEEFMNILMAQTLRAEPYLKFNSGQDAFYYQLFVEKNDDLKLPNVQQLFEQSFKTSNIKLREVPPCLIIQMPRFGKNYKMYPRIVPSQVLDITDVVEGQPPECSVCGVLASSKCVDCSKDFCLNCLQSTHNLHNQHHKSVELRPDFPTLRNDQTVPRIHLDLFAVVCIETSHYVSFVKAGELPDAPWLFFDSMSDRRGGQNGYNIPSMVSVPDLPEWLSDEGARKLHDSTPKDKLLPPFAKRLLCDAYMCMYVSRDVSMYK